MSEISYFFDNIPFSSLLNYLRVNIHNFGNIYSSETIIENATGEKPDSKYLIRHLESLI